jgi:hypothetical protein
MCVTYLHARAPTRSTAKKGQRLAPPAPPVNSLGRRSLTHAVKTHRRVQAPALPSPPA